MASLIPDKIIFQLSIIVVMMIILPSFNFYLNNILLVWGLGSLVLLIYGALIISMYYGIYISAKYHLIRKSAGIVAVTLVLLGSLSYLLYSDYIGDRLILPDYNVVYSELLFMLLFLVPALLVSSACRDWDLVLKYLFVLSPVIVFIAFFAWFLVGFKTYGDDSLNYLTLSYHVLTAGCVCLAKSFKGFHPVCWIASVVFLFIMVGSGSRGALVCVLLFVFLLFLRHILAFPKSKSSKYLKVGCVLLVLSLPVLYVKVFDDVSVVFERIGISSRIIDTLDDQSFLSSNSRADIRGAIQEGVKENPFGYGLYGDRYITVKYYYEGSEYAHNIFYEFLADYGVVFGPLLLLAILLFCTKCFWINKASDIGLLLLLILPSGLLKLFFSDSYLMNIDFAILLGFLFSVKEVNYLPEEVVEE